MITEARKQQTVRLTTFQKTALAKIVASPNDKLAAEQISKGRNLRAARDLLVKLGLITADENTAALTPKGEQIMKDHNLMDDSGELTDEAADLAYEKGSEPKKEEPKDEFGGLGNSSTGPTSGGPNPFESLRLIQSVNSNTKVLEEDSDNVQ